MRKLFLVLLACVVLSGCATSSGINKLRIGMSSSEVKESLGTPKLISSSSNTTIWKYELFQPFVGWMPYYLVFNSTDQLTSYKADEDEYQRNQQALRAVAQQINDANLQRQQYEQQQRLIEQQAQQQAYYNRVYNRPQVIVVAPQQQEQIKQPTHTTVQRDWNGNVTGFDTQ